MQNRMILAIALSIAVLLGYQYFYTASPPPQGKGSPAGKDNAAVAAPAAGQDAGAPAATPVSAAPGGIAPRMPVAARRRRLHALRVQYERGIDAMLESLRNGPLGGPRRVV